MSWHVPNDDEIDFALQILREIVEPTIKDLESLLLPGTLSFFSFELGNNMLNSRAGVVRDNVWRNDFCRLELFV